MLRLSTRACSRAEHLPPVAVIPDTLEIYLASILDQSTEATTTIGHSQEELARSSPPHPRAGCEVKGMEKIKRRQSLVVLGSYLESRSMPSGSLGGSSRAKDQELP